MHPLDYIFVKMALLKEEKQKQIGVPQRTNVREDTLNAKIVVKPILTNNGWLPLFGDF